MSECNHPCCGSACRKKKTKSRRKPLPKVTKKQRKRNNQYSKKRREIFEEGDECEAKLEGCTWFATDLHHPAGRIGSNLLKMKKCKKVCRSCHRKLEDSPKAAKELGLSESRLK